MYSTKPRNYTVYNAKLESSVESLAVPLKELATAHLKILAKYKNQLNEQRDDYREYLEEKFIKEYNKTHESSYEGEIDVEDQVLAKFPAEQGIGKAGEEEVELLLTDFSKKYSIVTKAHWFFPQMVALFAKCAPQKNEFGVYSGKLLYDNYISRDPTLYALWLIAMYPKRSIFMKSQVDPALRDFCSLVPLVLAGFKKMHNIPYHYWTDIEYVVEPNLAKAMMLDELPEITVEEVLEDRRQALLVKSGTKAGEIRNPVTTYSIYIPHSSLMYGLPTLAKIMMCQTWCAHPTNRTKYMVLNPLEWDEMPQPLVDSEVFVKPEVKESAVKKPWKVKPAEVEVYIPWE